MSKSTPNQQTTPQQKTPEESLMLMHEQYNGNELNSRTLFEQIYQHCKVLMQENKTLRSQLAQLIEEKQQWGKMQESGETEVKQPQIVKSNNNGKK